MENQNVNEALGVAMAHEEKLPTTQEAQESPSFVGLWYALSAIFFCLFLWKIIAAQMLEVRVVGGDAYNYIIGAGRSASNGAQAAAFAIPMVGFMILGVLCQIKRKIVEVYK